MVIYKITFPNNKVYIGQTIEKIGIRISHHKTDAKLERDKTEFSPSGSKIGNAIRKYGLEKEWVEIIDSSDNIEDLNNKEEFWIKKENSLIEGYNIKPGGGNRRHSEETKRKIGRATKERWKNPEIANRMREGLKKGTELMKLRAGEERVEREIIICQNCGVSFRARPAEKRKFCSARCAAKNASNISLKKRQELKKNDTRKNDIYEWAIKNSELIKKCPFNKISTNLSPLLEIVGVSDWRSLTSILNYTSRKDFLSHLKDYVKMYAEPDEN